MTDKRKAPQRPRRNAKRNPRSGNRPPQNRETAAQRRQAAYDAWIPKTKLGKLVKEGTLTDINVIIARGEKILEPEIVDMLIPNLDSDLLLIGQSKGKFGGGARRVFKQTQKKTREGNKPKFATYAVVGNKDGFVGIGYGKAKETVPAREKAIRNAKLNIFRVRRGCGSWDCVGGAAHSIPCKVTGRNGSNEMTLMAAPKGKGLIIEKECKKILELAGIHDVWSKTKGQTKSKINQVRACVDALKTLTTTRLSSTQMENNNVLEGKAKKQKVAEQEE